MHLNIYGYPPEGADAQFVFYDKSSGTASGSDSMTVSIPAGTGPFLYNYTCTLCYDLTYKLGVSMNYVGDSSTTWAATYDSSIAIADVDFKSGSTDFSADLNKLTVGQPYYLVVLCGSPNLYYRMDFVAESRYQTVSGTFSNLPCTGNIDVALSSADNVHVAGVSNQ